MNEHSSELEARLENDGVSLSLLWKVLWKRKAIILAATFVFAAGAAVIAILQTPWFRAEVLLAHSEQKSTSSIPSQLGGLAALAGVSVGGGGSTEAIAILRSREFARAFIWDLDIMPLIFADEWDSARGNWVAEDPDEWPDIRDAVEYFHEEMLRVKEDSQTSLVTVAVEWTDPDIAASWAEVLVNRLNERMRQRALSDAEANVNYLQEELASTNVLTLQQAIGRLLESELQKLMLAKGNEEFAFRLIDRAVPPKNRTRPRRFAMVILGAMLGGSLAVLAVLTWHAIKSGNAGRGSVAAAADPK